MEENQTATLDYGQQVEELSQKMDRLKFLYEQYFIGRERMAPAILRQDVEKSMRTLVASIILIRNTGIRFKINSLKAKLTSFRRYWDRTLQQIEDGIYKRDRFRLKLYEQNQSKLQEATKVKLKKDKGKAKDTPKNRNIETLMKQLVKAKKKCKESTQGINYDKFYKTITSQSEALKKRYKCKSVRFKVVIENGKTKLKATPK